MVSKAYIEKKLSYDLNKLNIDHVGAYASEHRDSIDRMYAQGLIDDAVIDKIFESIVILKGLTEYDRIVSCADKRRPMFIDDSSLHPRCIIYAWKNGHLTDRQFLKIPLDHGYSIHNIGERYDISNLIHDLREKLLKTPAKHIPDDPKKMYHFFADPQ